MRALWAVAVAVGVAVAAGCDAGGGPAGSSDRVELAEVSVDGLDAAVREKKGSVVVVEFWAQWCIPCRDRFPEIVGLHRKYAGQGLTCVSVSIDDPSDKEKVKEFLVRYRATFPNFLLTDRKQSRQRLTERFRLGEMIPFAAVFGRDGEIAWSGTGLAPGRFEELIAREVARGR